MSVLLKVLLQTILLAAAIISASGQVCYSSRSSYTSNVYYSGRLYYYSTSYTYYVSCGSWWRRSRCSRTGYSQRSGYRRSTMYRSVLQYSRTSRCCAGYTGTPPNCLPVCSICHNGGTCVAPQTCRCASGWIGSTCNEVPTPIITALPSGPIQGAMVGSPQDIRCRANTISGVSLSSVNISWTRPGGESIINNSRVTISPTTSNGTNYTSSLQFTYLMEGDEGIYTCNVMIVNAQNSISLQLANLTVPAPSVVINAPTIQIVGQSLVLKCDVTTVKGITSSVNVIWSRDRISLKRTEGIAVSSVTRQSLLYKDAYSITQLSTADENKMYWCMAVIAGSSSVRTTESVMLNVTIPFINIIMLPPGPIQGAMVGSPQDIQCIVSTVSGVELSSVIISWMEPGGESIANDSRMTITPTTSSGNNYTSSLQFAYLMEGDEGIYTINVMILDTIVSKTFELKSLLIPVPHQLYVTAPATQTVGQSLVLKGSITVVRGITSRVYMVWSSNGLSLETMEANVSSITNDSVEYTAYYTIVQLNETDDGTVYQCKVVIDSSLQVAASNNIVLHTTIPSPIVTVNMPDIPTVGQPLSMECIMTTVRGITSTIDIIWSRDGVEVKRTTGASITSSSGSSIVYKDLYNISLVTTNEEEKVYQCRGVINATPNLTAINNILLDLVVPDPTIIILPDSPTFETMIGSPQDIQCIVSTVSGVELSSVMISWIGPGGESITNDSRVTISPTTSGGNNYTSSLQFTYLMEGDEGMYTCNVMILEAIVSSKREMILNVPNPIVKVSAPDNQIVGEPLTLMCNVTTVRGITSRMDIVWSSDGLELKRIKGMQSSVENNSFVTYMDPYIISPLGTDDEGRSYQCEVIINQVVAIAVNDSIILDVTVPAISIDVSQSTEGSIVGLPHVLTCTVTAVVGVSPSLVKIDWIGDLESSQINVFDQNVTRSHDRLIFNRIVEFSPLLEQNIGEYMCSGRIIGFGNVSKLESALVIANDPSLTVNISSPLLTGMSGEDAIELLCTAIVAEDVLSAIYQFTWIKDDTPVDLSDNRIIVTVIDNTSSFVIKATDSNATLDNGIYRCEVNLTISGVNSFSKTSEISTVLFKAMIPPVEFFMIKAITAPYSAEISWVVLHIILDKETYTVKYSTDMSLQNSREVVIENDDEFSINQTFSVNITGLIPFTTYYYIMQANNSVGSTYTDIMNFTTNQTAPSAAPSNFQAINVTSTSITFIWDTLVDGANGIIKLYVITVKVDDFIIVVNVSGANTMETIHGLTPFTTYSCTLHVVTLSDGPLSDPITVTTAEQTPVAPVMKGLTAIDSGSVRVEWNKPEVNYGMITTYTIYYTIENGTERSLIVPSNGQDVQSYVFSEMKPHQLITAKITATNGGGISEPSNEIMGRSLEAAPGIVEIVDIVSLSDAAVTVTWSPPVQPNGIVTSYEIIYSVYEDDAENITYLVTSNIFSFNVTDLYAGVPYQITVVAYTSVGRGEENDPQTFFTQEQIPIKPPENVIFQRNGSAINASWDPLSLIEAKGFPTYTVTLRPLSSVGNQSNDDIISITTNQTSVISDELDPSLEYILVVTVTTTIGEASTDGVNVTIPNIAQTPNEEQMPTEHVTIDDENDKDDNNRSIILIIILIVLVVTVLLMICLIIYLIYLRRQRKKKSSKLDNDNDEIEMQSSLQNSAIFGNPSTSIGISNPMLPVEVFDNKGKCLL